VLERQVETCYGAVPKVAVVNKANGFVFIPPDVLIGLAIVEYREGTVLLWCGVIQISKRVWLPMIQHWTSQLACTKTPMDH
jgi:hypothetical protein